MARDSTLTQCKMRVIHEQCSMHPNGYYFDVAWISSKLAKKGTRIKFRDLDGIYEVVEVWGTRSREEVELMERSFKHQRTTSDV